MQNKLLLALPLVNVLLTTTLRWAARRFRWKPAALSAILAVACSFAISAQRDLLAALLLVVSAAVSLQGLALPDRPKRE